jgi:hypothetical protein
MFKPNPRTPWQMYCSKKVCQRKRKSDWQKQKLKDDPSYRESQKAAAKCWREKNPEYWRTYRREHPEYTKRNRERQRERRRAARVANMDVIVGKNVVSSGVYRIMSVGLNVANMDSILARIEIISNGFDSFHPRCKEMT